LNFEKTVCYKGKIGFQSTKGEEKKAETPVLADMENILIDFWHIDCSIPGGQTERG
jgi:hypothetical protein